jgi:hypothetical protein
VPGQNGHLDRLAQFFGAGVWADGEGRDPFQLLALYFPQIQRDRSTKFVDDILSCFL